jgi:hypothetical protein
VRARRRHRAIRAVAALLLLLAAGAVAACNSEDGAETSGAERDRADRIGLAMTETIPAQIDAQPQAFVSSAVLRPVTNAWRTASHERLTEVDAGALAADRSTGAFAIFRHDFAEAHQDVTLVEVKDSGRLRITKAPIGAGVEESAQRDGEIEFVGARGVRGTLHLGDDTVSLKEG